MPERPLLFFPSPERAEKSKLGGGASNFHRPSVMRQWDRLTPRFEQLQQAFVQVQPNANGIVPENVLVIETFGSIENFANAIKRIEGFEWMGEIEEEFTANEDFYDEQRHGRPLSGRLYCVLSNQQALQQMLSLWRAYANDQNMNFRHGLTKFRDVFCQLKDIRRWGIQDRLEETGVLMAWQEDLRDPTIAEQPISCEIELWYRNDSRKRNAAENDVTQFIEQVGGQVISQTTISEISYHALLATLPRNEVQNIIDGNYDASFICCESIQFVRPCGQIVVGKEPTDGDMGVAVAPVPTRAVPTLPPTIALLDGLPLENHALLAGRLMIDDPDNWGGNYTAAARKHGTAMASLIVQDDLSNDSSPLSRQLYVRPIMQPLQDFNGNWNERVPQNVLFTDLLHRSVRRLFEHEGAEPPTAPTVKIINLSIGDPNRQFLNAMSPAAKLLDWLSVKYNVLFIVSAGNHSSTISINKTLTEFNALSDNEREAEIVKALYGDMRNRRILSPAETINGLTIGSLHMDNSLNNDTPNRIDLLARATIPSPVTAFGCGYRRAIKPDLLFSGGRQLYVAPILTAAPISFSPSYSVLAPGNETAAPGNRGQLNATAFSRGTSNAAALVSRAAGICYDSLLQLLSEQTEDINIAESDVPLLKAMLVHGCSWGEDARSRLEEILSVLGADSKKAIARWLGYGTPDINKVLECTRQRATILGFGQLTDGLAHLFSLPLPPSLGQQRIRRRLTVSLAWFSRIIPNTQKYRESSLWFEILDNRFASERTENNWQAVRRGTVQHEIFESERAEPISDDAIIQIKVNCRKDAGEIENPVPYGLVVSLEAAEGQGTDIAIYDEIRDRIATAVQMRTTV